MRRATSFGLVGLVLGWASLAPDPIAIKVQGPDTAGNALPITTLSGSPLSVQGDTASGATDGGNPVKTGGLANSTTPSAVVAGQRVNAHYTLSGRQVIAVGTGLNTADAAGSANWPTQADAGTPMAVTQMVFNGSTWDRMRTPSVFKTVNAVAVGTETTVWTPAAGKKFRLMGLNLSTSTAQTLTLRDNTAGTTIFVSAMSSTGSDSCVLLGNGILSAAANNVLTAQSGAAANLTGTLWGTEE